MIFNLNLSNPWFDLMKNGLKIYEGRLYDKVKFFNIDDIIIIHSNNTSDPFKVKIINKFYYRNFIEAINDIGAYELLPIKDITTEMAINIYQDIYPIEKQLISGVIILEIVKI